MRQSPGREFTLKTVANSSDTTGAAHAPPLQMAACLNNYKLLNYHIRLTQLQILSVNPPQDRISSHPTHIIDQIIHHHASHFPCAISYAWKCGSVGMLFDICLGAGDSPRTVSHCIQWASCSIYCDGKGAPRYLTVSHGIPWGSCSIH